MLRVFSRSFLFAVSLSPSLFATQQSSQAPGATPPANQTPAPATNPTSSPDAKKTKKVWTNDNLADASGTVSVVGDPKHPIKGKSETPADPAYVANAKKQLEKLTAQMADIDKQLLALKNFNEGEPTVNPGRELHKGYNTEPIAQQIPKLEAKKKEIQIKIDALLDEARGKGVLPGQLR